MANYTIPEEEVDREIYKTVNNFPNKYTKEDWLRIKKVYSDLSEQDLVSLIKREVVGIGNRHFWVRIEELEKIARDKSQLTMIL